MPTRRAILTGLAGAAVAPAASAAPKVHTVVIDKMAFSAPPAALRVGDTVEWVNRDIFRHTATARDGAFNLDLPPNGRGRTVLKKAGVVQVYCRYHTNMTTTLKVAK
jgi:plastocyanin